MTDRLPNFLFIGPDKAGSTWLHEVLIRHPQVYMPEAKDLYFFDRYYARGLDWYASKFVEATPKHRIVGEVTQDYLFEPEAAARIRADLGPDVKFMVTLREPAARAHSSYLYMLKQGETPGTFAEALDGRPELIEHSRYGAGLRRFLEHYDASQIHVTMFDDLKADPQAFIDGVFAFLGIDRVVLDEESLSARLPAAKARSVALARLARAAANFTRVHDGADLVGRVKRSAITQRLLYTPLRDEAPRLSEEDAAEVRARLAEDVAELEAITGLPVAARWGWVPAH